jgi:hypothetical protein
MKGTTKIRVRLARIAEGDNRRLSAFNLENRIPKAAYAAMQPGEAVMFIGGAKTSVVFAYKPRAAESSGGMATRTYTTIKVNIERGTFDLLKIQDWANAAGLEIENLPEFLTNLERILRRKGHLALADAVKAQITKGRK